MRNTISLLGSFALVALLGVGCAGPEQKFGRGVSNMAEIARGTEFQRSVEQGGLFDGTDNGVAIGAVRGFNRTLARTGLGVFEVVTSPLPPYGPVWTSYLNPRPNHPDSFAPRSWSDSIFDSDYSLGFSGGTVLPWIPGNRFRVFDN
jgi:putative exosortase-associated protein (TIGR04073 family)